MSSHWSDTVMLVTNTVLGPIGVIGNGLLVILLVKYTPKSLKSYSIFILMLAIAACFTGLSSSMTHTRVHTTDNATILKFSGPCQLIDISNEEKAEFCLFWFLLQKFLCIFCQTGLIVSVLFRIGIFYFSMEKTSPLILYGPLCLFAWAMIGCMVITFLTTLTPFNIITETVRSVQPFLIDSGSTYFAIPSWDEFPHNVIHITWLVLPWFVVFLALFGRWKVRVKLIEHQYSDYLKMHHEAIANSLVVQSFPSILFMFINLPFKNHCPICENIVLLPVPVMSVVVPTAIMCCVPSYRNGLLAFLRIRRYQHVTPSTTLSYTIQMQSFRI